MTTISDCGNSYSVHSGSVNLKQMNGRRAAICLVDGNQTMNNESSYDSEVELQHEPNDNAMQMGSVHGALNSAAPWMEPQNIPSHWAHRPGSIPHTQERLEPARRVIRRDEGLVQALTLPTISVFNMRSI